MLHLRRPPYSLEISVAERVHLDKHTENVSANNEDSRLIHLSILAAVIGVIAGFVAFLLVSLIGLISNLVFYQRVAFDFPNLEAHTLGPLVIIVPVIGGLIIGVMAKYGTPKIRGHGIPEAMEAVLTNRSRIAPIVALFKPLSAAIAIGTGGRSGRKGRSSRPAARSARSSGRSSGSRRQSAKCCWAAARRRAWQRRSARRSQRSLWRLNSSCSSSERGRSSHW